MNIKQRVLRNWITTIFGTLLMFAALAMLIANRIPSANVDFGWWEMVGTALLGWVFLMAKDSLLEGVFMGIFHVKEK
ncbi:MAG TPA: hypothetical protein VJ963_11790 [Bacteroidales bacterium]|nr:hypothetical protein [Bacteroidales bacterium]